jgi:hypothetical protein
MIKLGDLINQRELQKLALPTWRCTTGKVCFESKQAARQAMHGHKGHRTQMRVFRCGYCEKWHLGHKRGAIL